MALNFDTFFPIKNRRRRTSVLHDKFFGFKKSLSVSLIDNCSSEEGKKYHKRHLTIFLKPGNSLYVIESKSV